MRLLASDIVHNSVISISDQSQSLDVQIAVLHCDATEFPESNTSKFEVIGAVPQAKADTPAPAATPATTPNTSVVIEEVTHKYFFVIVSLIAFISAG
jgi:hypothetical protein